VSTPEPGGTYVLTLICPDRPGIVHAVTGFLVERGGNILESQQFGDPEQDRFFMRVRFAAGPATTLERLRAEFGATAEAFGMRWELWDATAPYRTLVMVSRFGHCLNDLLFRWRNGDLQIDIAGVVSNHRDYEHLAAAYDVPFHHVPVTPETKRAAEDRLLRLVDELDIDLVVLARYMQVLSDETCKALEGRAINIHHSFLPSFKGAKPYHQAFERGVKLVGATAHYITADLDEGPIIEQDVLRVDHGFSAAQLVAAGRDVEAQVLSRAVRWHAETRVLLNGSRTVVFR
jgi:formyltetrahydrofolate deformylase